MRIVATLLLLFLSRYASADGVVRLPGANNMIVFGTTPCTNEKVLPFIGEEFLPLFKKAGVLWEGKAYAACWALHPEDSSVAVVIDETGSGGALPVKSIAFDPEA